MVSSSKDQSTRIYCEIEENDSLGLKNVFKEISRAQIHGYDINAIALVKIKDQVSDMIICGADEKVLRLLEPVPHFINYHNVLTNTEIKLHLPENEENFLISRKPLIYKTMMESG